jgi:hypothetical protein
VPKPEISIQVFLPWIWLWMSFEHSWQRSHYLEPEKSGRVSHWVFGYSGWWFLKSKNRFWSLTGGSIKYQRASFDPKPSFKKWRNLTLIKTSFCLLFLENYQFYEVFRIPKIGGPFGFWKHQRTKRKAVRIWIFYLKQPRNWRLFHS